MTTRGATTLLDTSNFKPLAVPNQTFLEAIFGTDWPRAHVCAFREDPLELDTLGLRHYWGGGSANVLLPGFTPDMNQYFTISIFELDPHTGRQRRKKSLHEATFCIVLDDVGDPKTSTAKVEWSRVKLDPSWVLETSPGNYQVGYIVGGGDTRSGKVSGLLDALVASGLVSGNKDPGMKGVTRYVRLPEGTNTKKTYGPGGFSHRLVLWKPSRVYSLEAIADAYGVRADFDLAPDTLTASQHAAVPEGEDKMLDTLIRAGLFQQKIDTNRWLITCPWVDEHTGGANSGTAYLGNGAFKCHHGHCEERTSEAFRDKIREDYPTEWSEACRESVIRDFGDIGGPLDPFEGLREGVGDQMDRLVRVAAQGKFAGAFRASDLNGVKVSWDQNWLVDRLVPVTGVGAIYGASGVGKTFVMLDLALRIACGEPWNGHDVDRTEGAVLYVSSEGGSLSAMKRLKAWSEYRGQDLPDNFSMYPGSVMLGRGFADDQKALVSWCRETMGLDRGGVKLIVLDTLNRNFLGDENSTEDMTAFVQAADWIRRELGCFVMVVHHSGKDAAKGLRGSSALLGAVDVELQVARDKSVGIGHPGEVVVSKLRDAEDGMVYGFKLDVVKLGTDAKLRDVVCPVAVECKVAPKPVKLTGSQQRTAYQYLSVDLGGVPTLEDFIIKELKDQFGIPKGKALLSKLEEKGVVSRLGDYWCVEKDVEVIA